MRMIFDPQRSVTITPDVLQTNCDFSPFEGFRTKGYPHQTYARGKLVAEQGKFVGTVGAGQFLKRATGPGIE